MPSIGLPSWSRLVRMINWGIADVQILAIRTLYSKKLETIGFQLLHFCVILIHLWVTFSLQKFIHAVIWFLKFCTLKSPFMLGTTTWHIVWTVHPGPQLETKIYLVTQGQCSFDPPSPSNFEKVNSKPRALGTSPHALPCMRNWVKSCFARFFKAFANSRQSVSPTNRWWSEKSRLVNERVLE